MRGHVTPGEAFISGLSDMRRGLAMCSASPPMKVPTGSSRGNVERQGRKESFTTKTKTPKNVATKRSNQWNATQCQKDRTGYNRKQKRIRPRLVCSKASFLQVNFCCFFRSDWTWVMDSRPLKMQTKKTRNLFPQKRRPCFGLDSNSPQISTKTWCFCWRPRFFFKCQKIPIQNHGLWFLVHFFLETCLFLGGFGDF